MPSYPIPLVAIGRSTVDIFGFKTWCVVGGRTHCEGRGLTVFCRTRVGSDMTTPPQHLMY